MMLPSGWWAEMPFQGRKDIPSSTMRDFSSFHAVGRRRQSYQVHQKALGARRIEFLAVDGDEVLRPRILGAGQALALDADDLQGEAARVPV
jgi:hypothetical protein